MTDIARDTNDKTALTVFAETAGITMYQIAKENGIANSTIINAFKKSVDQLSIRVLKAVAATAGISAGELLNILINLEGDC